MAKKVFVDKNFLLSIVTTDVRQSALPSYVFTVLRKKRFNPILVGEELSLCKGNF